MPNLFVCEKEVKDGSENINVTANDILEILSECAILFCLNCEIL